ncbi:MAG: PCP reductase family protein [Myxococcota bacterium]|jgi:hypothetical protein|nr:PCP reductase family protein [Myxococcota bacterium]
MADRTTGIEWSDEATARLQRVPVFLRSMVRKRAEAAAQERGDQVVSAELMMELGKRRHEAAAMGGPPFDAPAAEPPAAAKGEIVWTAAAQERLDESPPFFHAELIRIAEEAARAGGHLEVNLALLDGLESQEEFRRRLEWEPAAESSLADALAERPEIVRDFVRPAMEEAAERIARRDGKGPVTPQHVSEAFDTEGAGVEWSPEALDRVRNAPEFVRAGIKKAAEAGARREGISLIHPDDLTRFRNRAMLRAVKRMRGFGFRELTFDVFDTARERVPRLKDNPQAEKRFAAIRGHVEGKGGLGVMDKGLLDKMKRHLAEGASLDDE